MGKERQRPTAPCSFPCACGNLRSDILVCGSPKNWHGQWLTDASLSAHQDPVETVPTRSICSPRNGATADRVAKCFQRFAIRVALRIKRRDRCAENSARIGKEIAASGLFSLPEVRIRPARHTEQPPP
jgi:hypothetical protein